MSELVEDLEHWLDEPAYVDTGKRGREIDRASWLIGRARDEIVRLRAECGKLTWDPDRDEIVRLRAALERHDRLLINAAAVRDEVLEEAARVCDALYDGYSTATTATDQTDPEQVWLDACDRAAAAIRALKEKGNAD